MDKCRKNIALIEPSDIIFEGLVNLIQRGECHYYFYRTSDLEEFGELCIKINFDIAIINPQAIQNRKSEFLKLRRLYPGIRWIGLIYSYFDNDVTGKFDDIINITDSQDLLSEKLRRAMVGCRCEEERQEGLTERELDVLVLLVKGQSNKEIASNLNISIHTVISHRKNITEKTGIKSLSGLTIYAISKKIVPLDLSL